MKTRTKVAIAVVAVIVLAATIAYDLASRRRETKPTATAIAPSMSEPSRRPGPSMPVLLAITDSVALASNGNEKAPGYPAIIANQMGWSAVIDAVSGRGFVVSNQVAGLSVPPFKDHFPALSAAHPDAAYVIIDGGRNDFDKPQDAVFAAMNAFYDSVRAAYPKAKIFVTVPLRPSPPAALIGDGSPRTYETWAREVRSAADRINAHVIDARAEGWYDNTDLSPYIWTDGIHLNGKGQQFYADKMLSDMRSDL